VYGVYISQLYVILELVPSTVIFWTELNCWCKSYSNKATLLLGWSHRYKNSTVVITIRLTVAKYPYLKWQWIFYFWRRYFLYHCQDFYQTWLYTCVTRRVSSRTPGSPPVFVVSVLLIFFCFVFFAFFLFVLCLVSCVTKAANVSVLFDFL
jgi:hypothetical protein